MELNKIADGKLQEAFDKSINEVMDACVSWGRKRKQDGTIAGKVVITIGVVGAEGGCATIDDFSVASKLPERHHDVYEPGATSPKADGQVEGQMSLIPVTEAERVLDCAWAEQPPAAQV